MSAPFCAKRMEKAIERFERGQRGVGAIAGPWPGPAPLPHRHHSDRTMAHQCHYRLVAVANQEKGEEEFTTEPTKSTKRLPAWSAFVVAWASRPSISLRKNPARCPATSGPST